MEQRSYRGWLWILALLGLLIDQGTKYGVFALLKAEGAPAQKSLIPGAFRLMTYHERDQKTGELVPMVNHGALFGFAQEHKGLANMTFAIISALAALLIICWSIPQSTAQDRSLCIALGLILGGTLGNLYDRLFFGGVRDFLDWYYGYDWPVFNIADCCLVLGAGLLLFQAFRQQPSEQGAEEGSIDSALSLSTPDSGYVSAVSSKN